MPTQDILLLAVTKMLGGMCIAGVTTDPDPITTLRWVRPVRDHSYILLGDITTEQGTILRPFDVVAFSLIKACPEPPHTEDWLADFVRHRPRIVRRLVGGRRSTFLREYVAADPCQIMDQQERSLCLLKPDDLKASFRLDSFSGRLDANLGFAFGSQSYRGTYAKGGLSVTDIKWRALGRSRLPESGGWTEFDSSDLKARLGIEEVFLAVGLTRSHQGESWPIVVGVHTIPDYEAEIDYDNL